MSFEDYRRQVIVAIAAFIGERPERVTADRFLCVGRGSLGIDGADADELLAMLQDRFQTTFVRFNRDDYFGSERSFSPISIIFWYKAESDQLLKKITVGELVRYMWEEKPIHGC